MGTDPKLKYVVNVMIIAQLIAAYLLRDASWSTILVAGYCFGGVLNHSMTLAIHEISHNLAFGHSKPLLNRFLAIWANLPLGIPYSITFKKYHLEHHKYQGDQSMDVDIPSRLEGKLFYNTFTKVLWVVLQPFFYALRPLFMRPKPLTGLELLNAVVQLVFDVIIVFTMGYKSLAYLIIGNFLAMGLHPVAGHFISEHFMFKKGYETYSYYGPLNWITFNVGYHNEHHDFPNIPGCRLPEVRHSQLQNITNLFLAGSFKCSSFQARGFGIPRAQYKRVRLCGGEGGSAGRKQAASILPGVRCHAIIQLGPPPPGPRGGGGGGPGGGGGGGGAGGGAAGRPPPAPS